MRSLGLNLPLKYHQESAEYLDKNCRSHQRSCMKIIDNINTLLGDDLKASIRPKDKLKIAASCFSIYAYEGLKRESLSHF